MKNGTKACIDDCTAFGFPFFKDCVIDHIPHTNSKAAGYSEDDDQQDKDVCLEDDLSTCEAEENDNEDPCLVKTPMGTLHLKTAEVIYLNGEKTTFGAKVRQRRFYGTSFLEQNQLKEYNSTDECCPNVIKKGKVLTLLTFADDQIKVKGEVCWLSKSFNPLRTFCRVQHSTPVNVWMPCKGKARHIRCVIK